MSVGPYLINRRDLPGIHNAAILLSWIVGNRGLEFGGSHKNLCGARGFEQGHN